MAKIMEGLRTKFKEIPDLQVYMRPVQNLQLGSKSRYQFTPQSVGFDGVNEWADKLMQKMRADPMFRDVTSDSQMKGLNVNINIDREKAASAGVSIADVRTALYSAYGEKQVSTIYMPVNTYYVILEAAVEDRQYETDLNKIFVRGRATDKLIPPSSIAMFTRTVGPTAVNHQGQISAVTLSFNLTPDVFLGDATKQIEAFIKAIDLPPSIITSYGGDAAVFKSNQSGQLILISSALSIIYILLGVLYENYIHPLTILAGLPSAAIGAILALRIFSFELTIIASIGILLLMDPHRQYCNQGMTPEKAIREASILRFRSIMMTTFDALMGAIPIAFGLGAGAELRQPLLGISVAGDLIFSQFVTLIITPVIYLYLDKFAGNDPMDILASVLEGA